MAGIVVTKVGDVINIVFNGESPRDKEYSHNVVTGAHLALLNNDLGIETDLLGDGEHQYDCSQFNTIGGVSITTEQILFDELEKML